MLGFVLGPLILVYKATFILEPSYTQSRLHKAKALHRSRKFIVLVDFLDTELRELHQSVD